MATQRGPRCKLARREKTDLFHLSGIRPIAEKCRFDVLPGGNPQSGGRLSDYAVQLRMKMLIRRYYNILEKQFRNCYARAERMRGSTADSLLCILECRLDNTVYRMGFASTRAEARQLVSHGSVLVNGSRVNIPSYQVKADDVIALTEKAKGQLRVAAALELVKQRDECDWVKVDADKKVGTVLRLPGADDFPAEFKVNLVIELYSK